MICIIDLIHELINPFLISIGVFSSYFVLSGKRALSYKKHIPSLLFDKILSSILLIISIVMILMPIILNNSINIVLTVFGVFGLFIGTRDFIAFRSKELLSKNYLKLHLGKILGGYISAFTAFIVVNNLFPPLANWLLPGVFGGFYIAYWLRKLK